MSAIRPKLSEAASNLKKTMADGATGKSLASLEVMKLNERWEDYRAEAEGLDLTQWLRAEVTPTLGLPWFQTMARCVEAVGGRAVAVRLHSDALRWLVCNVTNPNARGKVLESIHDKYRAQSRAPVSLGQVKMLARALKVVAAARHKKCATCARLRAQLEVAGVTPEV